MSVIAFFWQSLPCWLIWDRFQVVTSWAELTRFYGTLIKGLSGAPHQKKCLLIVILVHLIMLVTLRSVLFVTSWAKLAHIFHIYFCPPPMRTHQQGSGRRSFPCLSKYANHCWPYQNLLPFQLGWPPRAPGQIHDLSWIGGVCPTKLSPV